MQGWPKAHDTASTEAQDSLPRGGRTARAQGVVPSRRLVGAGAQHSNRDSGLCALASVFTVQSESLNTILWLRCHF